LPNVSCLVIVILVKFSFGESMQGPPRKYSRRQKGRAKGICSLKKPRDYRPEKDGVPAGAPTYC
jgi:hypothetical protein